MAKFDGPWQGVTLEEVVRRLVDEGKRANAPEFQVLIQVFGLPKIKAMVDKYKKERVLGGTVQGEPGLAVNQE